MFKLDGKLWESFNWFANLIVLNFCFIICCLPIVTIGASKMALMEVTCKIHKEKDVAVLKEFLYSLKNNIKTATGLWLGYLVIMAVVGANIYALINLQLGWISMIFMTATSVVFFVVNGTFVYTMMLHINYHNSLKNNLINGCILALGNLPITIVILLVEFLPLVLIVFFTRFWLFIITAYCLIGFSGMALINHLLFNKVKKRINEDTRE